MSAAAHLYPVPDPDDTPPHQAADVPGEGAAAVEPDPAAEPQDEPAQGLVAEAGDTPEDLDDNAEEPGDKEPGEEDTPRRALAMPDLRPYVTADLDTAKEFGVLVVEVTRTTAPRIRRAWAPVGAGTRVLFGLARDWFTGKIAPKVPPIWRLLGVPVLVVYAVARTVAVHPWSPAVLVLAWPVAALVAGRWAAVKAGKGSSKEDSKEPAKAFGKRARRTGASSLAARLAAAFTGPSAKASATPADEAAEETAAGPEEPPAEAPVEVPAAPSRDDIVKALHALVGTSSGVLNTALRDHLRCPSTRAVREALEAAGIPHRAGVRAMGGIGPGVHKADFPPLPAPREGAQGTGVVAGQEPTTTPTTPEEGPREGFRVVCTGHGGVTIYDLSDSHRYHRIERS